jgi:hypothetical protein
VKIPLGREPAATPAERHVRRELECEPPQLPGLAPDRMRRWRHSATWQPPETEVLSRHRAIGGGHWIVTNRRQSPDGYRLEFDLGVVQRHEQPGTLQLVARGDGFVLTDGAQAPADGERALGHVEQAAFPMMDVLELRRVTATGQLILVAGPADPMLANTEPVERLGYIEGFPVHPRELVVRPPWNLTRLIRTTDRARWRHVYATAAFDAAVPGDEASVALGSLFTGPGPGLASVWRGADGRVTSDVHVPWQDTPGHVARTAPKWVAAPLAWSRRPSGWALRATASRARRFAAATAKRTGPAQEPAVLGFIRTSPAPGCSPLYSALHPVLEDQFVTRSTLEAKDMGYWIEGILGYVGDLGADRRRGPREILWGSRFGADRRYVED